jgi:uncharacterized protein (TIGR00266 family)
VVFLVKCEYCGSEIDADAKFCPKCGGATSLAPKIRDEMTSLDFEIKFKPSYSLLEVKLPAGGLITAEGGSMTYMSSNIEIKTRTRMKDRGIWGALKVSILGGESLFINDYISQGKEGKIGLVSAPLGDITPLEVGPGRGFIVQSAAYIASTAGVKLDTKWQGFTKGLFGQNLFMLKSLGEGKLFINTFGAIDKHLLAEGEKLIVDNFHLAALSASCQYKVRMFGGLKSTILGGEGLITEVTGPGEVYVQTKNPQEFANWLWRYMPKGGGGRRGGFSFGR